MDRLIGETTYQNHNVFECEYSNAKLTEERPVATLGFQNFLVHQGLRCATQMCGMHETITPFTPISFCGEQGYPSSHTNVAVFLGTPRPSFCS